MSEAKSEAPSDEVLMEKYQSGDEGAFQEIYRRYSHRVLGYLTTKTRNRPAAEDLHQAVWMKLHRARDQYEAHLPFTPWLFTICRNAAIDAARTLAADMEISVDPLEIEERAPVVTEPDAPAANLEDLGLSAVLGSMPAQQREALELRYTSEATFEEIAQRLGSTPSNARQLVSRGVRRLRRAVGVKGQPLAKKGAARD